jgi:hypothetical protein
MYKFPINALEQYFWSVKVTILEHEAAPKKPYLYKKCAIMELISRVYVKVELVLRVGSCINFFIVGISV